MKNIAWTEGRMLGFDRELVVVNNTVIRGKRSIFRGELTEAG